MFANVALKEQTAPLTYRIPSNLLIEASVGSLVEVFFRGKKSLGIIVSLKKSLPPPLKDKKILTIEKNICTNWVPKKTLELAERIARASLVPIGIILFRLMPPVLKRSLSSTPANLDLTSHHISQRFHFYGSLKSRSATYAQIIKRAKAQVLIVAPQSNIAFLEKDFKSEGIDFALLDSNTKQSYDLKIYNDFLAGKVSILVGTRKIIGWQGKSLKTIIVDDPINLAHKDDQQPYLDSASIALFRKKSGINVILGAPIITPELLYSENLGRAKRLKALSESLSLEITLLKKGLLSNSLIDFMGENNKTPIYLICPRKGIGGTMRCLDCDSILECRSCKAPAFLGGDNKCQECGSEINAIECQQCRGHNLQSFGIGIDAFERELKKEFVQIPKNIHLITEGEVSSILEGSLVVIGFADAPLSAPLLSRPYRLLGMIKDLASNCRVIVQTKNLDSSWWQILAGNQAAISKTLEERKKFNLSPYSRTYTIMGKSRKLELALKQKGCEFIKNNDTLKISVNSNQKINFSDLEIKNIKLKLPSLI